MLELLNQMDGFDSMGDVKVCALSHKRLILVLGDKDPFVFMD